MKKINKNILIILLLILVSFPAILPLLHHGFFVTDDGEWMIIRFSAFYQALHDGQFPIRFLQRLNFGYGYPVATFLYPGFMYFGSIIHILKINFVDTIKIILGTALLGTTIFTYFWLNKVFNKKLAAFVGAFASLYIPYHFYDVYTRGSVGEVFALMWVAFILWMIERKNIFFISIGIFLFLISHNTMAVLFLPLLFIYGLLRRILSYKQIFLSFILGILMSAFFSVPAIYELRYTNFFVSIISNPLDYFAKFYLIGISTFIIFICGCLYLILSKTDQKQKNLTIGFLFLTLLVAFFSSANSAWLWQFIPSSFIQFPFRLLSYLIFSIAFIVAFIISQTKTNYRIFIVLGIVMITTLSSYQFLMPQKYTDKDLGFYSTNEATTTVKDEYLPTWVKVRHSQQANTKVEIIKGKGQILNLIYNNKKILFSVNAKNNVIVKINTNYWPGWEVLTDNKKTNISYNNPEGVMEVTVNSGVHNIQAVFGETPIRLFSDVISFLSFMSLILIVFRKHRKP
ncbi:MAG TPA: hypothetical protein VF810_02270 [Patescibacteria group bacterium]